MQDGDTFQLGTGTVSAAMAPFLSEKRDLGVHTELIFGGIPALVEQGVITGARKTVHPGKIVGASFGPLSADEFAQVDGDERYELYTMSHTNDIQIIAAHDNMVRDQQRAACRPDGSDQRRDDRSGDLQRHGRRVRVRRRRAAREERPQRDGAPVDIRRERRAPLPHRRRCSRRAAPSR